MSKLNDAEKEAREHFTAWFLYLRETFYVREKKPDIRYAEDLGVSRSYVSSVVAGERQVGFDVALRMRAVFKRSLDQLAFQLPEVEQQGLSPSKPSGEVGARSRRRREGA